MQQSVTNDTNDEAKKKRNIFIFRMIAFTLFACILPFVFIAWRYDIFRTTNNVSAKVSLTGWGFIGLIIVFFFIRYCLNVLKQSVPFSMTYQILNGAIKIIMPLLLLLFVVDAIENNITLFKHALIVTIICEGVAIPINPLPKYMHDRGIDYYDGLMDTFITKWKGGNK